MLLSDILWNNPAGGTFSDPNNWLGGVAPGPADNAIFDLSGAYVVTFSQDATNFRLLVRNDDVTFDLGGFVYTLTSTSIADRSIVVGDNTADSARLTLTGGELSGESAAIGNSVSSAGEVVVSTGATWTNSSELLVGVAGAGSLVISGGGSVSSLRGKIGFAAGGDGTVAVQGPGSAWRNTFEINVGDFGTGSLTIEGGGTALSADLNIGLRDSASGDVTVDGSGSSLTSSGIASVGHEGSGSLVISRGGSVSSLRGRIGFAASGDGTVTIGGPDSTWSTTFEINVGDFGTGSLTIEGGGAASSADLSIGLRDSASGGVTVDGSGSSLNNSGTARVGNGGPGSLSISGGGSVSSGVGSVGGTVTGIGTVIVDGSGSTWTISGSLFVGGSAVSAGGTGTLTVAPGGTVQVGGTLKIWGPGMVNLNGGTLALPGVPPAGFMQQAGSLNYNAGTFRFTGDVDVISGGFFTSFYGSTPTIPAAKGLAIDGTATLLTPLVLGGGTFSAGSLRNPAFLQFNTGKFSLTDDDLMISSGGLFGPTVQIAAEQAIDVSNNATVDPTGLLELQDGAFSAAVTTNLGEIRLGGLTSLLGGSTLSNQGFVLGDGRISAALSNAPTGEVNASSGQRLIFTGTGNANDGSVNVTNGTVQFSQELSNSGQVSVINGTFRAGGPVTNTGTGFIGGREAILRFDDGLGNSGGVALSFGNSDVFGDITNEIGGQIAIGGITTATFYGDIVNNGQISLGPEATAVFLGNASGSGSFPGSGTSFFANTFSPGNSAAEVPFGGDVVFGSTANLEIELGGTAPGQFDMLDIAGQVTLDAAVNIRLLPGFTPGLGDTFQIMTFGSHTGDFATYSGLELGNGLKLQPVFSANSLTLVTVDAPDAPQVVDVSVGGTGWAVLGYSVSAGTTLPWFGIDRIQVSFSEDVAVDQGDGKLCGVNVPCAPDGYSFSGFAYDAATFTATWTVDPATAPLGTDKVLLFLDAGPDGVSSAVTGLPLDGNGDMVGGDNYQFRFNVLRGDVNGDTFVNVVDVVQAFAVVGNASTVDPRADFNGDGSINVVDVVAIFGRVPDQLPPAEPSPPPGFVEAAASSVTTEGVASSSLVVAAPAGVQGVLVALPATLDGEEWLPPMVGKGPDELVPRDDRLVRWQSTSADARPAALSVSDWPASGHLTGSSDAGDGATDNLLLSPVPSAVDALLDEEPDWLAGLVSRPIT